MPAVGVENSFGLNARSAVWEISFWDGSGNDCTRNHSTILTRAVMSVPASAAVVRTNSHVGN
ncbi:MAG: Hypothetical protein BHV28_11700 [Candidatus Tokpelaia hoelldobleri]|uniref:Uncharacterized protein n=1 Tax=Candidatus Tokpelaia hoelldobleri TaxID=1902579 RepID=A0A1U9JVI4_9HYPH|nr:MAG: Hypothetical protein BHV28_11700 [Candidatus Tokpelaia hoelldoblerii]